MYRKCIFQKKWSSILSTGLKSQKVLGEAAGALLEDAIFLRICKGCFSKMLRLLYVSFVIECGLEVRKQRVVVIICFLSYVINWSLKFY